MLKCQRNLPLLKGGMAEGKSQQRSEWESDFWQQKGNVEFIVKKRSLMAQLINATTQYLTIVILNLQ